MSKSYPELMDQTIRDTINQKKGSHLMKINEKESNIEYKTTEEALEAFQLLCKLEGIIPALEPSHAIAHLIKIAKDFDQSENIIVILCGRGDKDIFTVAKHLIIEIS